MKFKIKCNKQGKQVLWLTPDEFEAGVQYAKYNNITALFLWYGGREAERLTLDFSWLEQLPKIEDIECMLNLSSKSNITGLYNLPNLENLVYFNYDKLPLIHENLPNLKSLYTHYSSNHLLKESSFTSLPKLEKLKLWHINKNEDCKFLGVMPNLKKLELTWSRSIKSLNGLNGFKDLASLSLINLYTLEDVAAISECPNLGGIWYDGCKHINDSGKSLIKQINAKFKYIE